MQQPQHSSLSSKQRRGLLLIVILCFATLAAALCKSKCHTGYTRLSTGTDSIAIKEFQKITPITTDLAKDTSSCPGQTDTKSTDKSHKGRKRKQPSKQKVKSNELTPLRDITTEQVSPD